MVAGSLVYDTKLDESGFSNGIKKISTASITMGNLISKAFMEVANVIKGSLDSAISRIDTLNNFPKVMSNLGVSAEDAKVSIDKMSDGLAGLPTTLDEGALAVQRFTSANGDVKKSTDMFLALNNAILAGGASTEIQSSALEQLSQAYSKGKPDMMEWRTIQMAMPAQLKQIAQAMGTTSDALGEGLRNGTISMDDFMNTIIKLNTEGVGSFQSFAEQAKNSTGGIKTSITVAKTQIVKGLADIIQKADEALKQEGLPSIAEMIAEMGKKAKEVLDWIAERLPDIIEFIKEIAPIIVAIVTGFLTFNTITGIINGVHKAFALLNAVMAANPIVLIISLIAALVAAFIYLWHTNEDFRQFWIDLWENIKTAVETAWENIKKVFNIIIDFVKDNWQGLLLLLVNPFWGAFKLLYDNCDAFRDFIDNFVNRVKEILFTWWDNIRNFFTVQIPNLIQNIKNWFAELPQRLVEKGKEIIIGLANGIRNKIENVRESIQNIIDTIVNKMHEIIDKARQWGIDMIQGFINGIKSKMQDVRNAASSVGSAVKSFLHFSRPDEGPLRDYETWMPDFVQGLAKTMEKASPILEKEASSLAGKLKQSMGIKYAINGIDESAIDNMKNAISYEIGKASISGITGTANEILSANSQMVIQNNNVLELDGEKVYENQEIVRKNKKLQYAFGG